MHWENIETEVLSNGHYGGEDHSKGTVYCYENSPTEAQIHGVQVELLIQLGSMEK